MYINLIADGHNPYLRGIHTIYIILMIFVQAVLGIRPFPGIAGRHPVYNDNLFEQPPLARDFAMRGMITLMYITIMHECLSIALRRLPELVTPFDIWEGEDMLLAFETSTIGPPCAGTDSRVSLFKAELRIAGADGGRPRGYDDEFIWV